MLSSDMYGFSNAVYLLNSPPDTVLHLWGEALLWKLQFDQTAQTCVESGAGPNTIFWASKLR